MIAAMRLILALAAPLLVAACVPPDPPVRPGGGSAPSDPLPGDGDATPVGVEGGGDQGGGGVGGDDGAGGDPGLSADAQTLLDEHNRYRAAHCAPPLTWSDEVAQVAQGWADSLRDDGCAFEHSRTPYGENLAGGTTGALPPEAVVEMWYREVDKYRFPDGGFSMETGHFTQVVWRDTTELGCGMSRCGGMDIWVCNYAPPGNMGGAYKTQVLPTSCR